jgi:steroid delta-isomerase-like uncharacterized protein
MTVTGDDATSAATNKALARRYFEELFGLGELALAEELLAPDLRANGAPSSPEELRRFVASLREAFPDWSNTIEQQVAEGDTVVTRVTSRGTHRGPWLGIPATGREVSRPGIFIFRVADGKIAEIWDCTDQLGFVRQLGARVVLPAGA